MAEIVPVTSEALEAQVRNLLPSQRGFGEDLQASNVITPIIDLTAAAQGTTTPEILQTALAFGNQEPFGFNNASSTVINTPGFFRVLGVASIRTATTATINWTLTNGLANKEIWRQTSAGTTSNEFDFVVFLAAGESLVGQSDDVTAFLVGSTRQIADVNGNLVYPVGFTPQ